MEETEYRWCFKKDTVDAIKKFCGDDEKRYLRILQSLDIAFNVEDRTYKTITLDDVTEGLSLQLSCNRNDCAVWRKVKVSLNQPVVINSIFPKGSFSTKDFFFYCGILLLTYVLIKGVLIYGFVE